MKSRDEMSDRKSDFNNQLIWEDVLINRFGFDSGGLIRWGRNLIKMGVMKLDRNRLTFINLFRP